MNIYYEINVYRIELFNKDKKITFEDKKYINLIFNKTLKNTIMDIYKKQIIDENRLSKDDCNGYDKIFLLDVSNKDSLFNFVKILNEKNEVFFVKKEELTEKNEISYKFNAKKIVQKRKVRSKIKPIKNDIKVERLD